MTLLADQEAGPTADCASSALFLKRRSKGFSPLSTMGELFLKKKLGLTCQQQYSLMTTDYCNRQAPDGVHFLSFVPNTKP